MVSLLTYLSIFFFVFSQLNQSDLCVRRSSARWTVNLDGRDYVLHPVRSCCAQRGLKEKMRLPLPPFPSQPPTCKICTWVCFGSITPLLHSTNRYCEMLIIPFGIASFPVLPAGEGNGICKWTQEIVISCYIKLISALENIIAIFIPCYQDLRLPRCIRRVWIFQGVAQTVCPRAKGDGSEGGCSPGERMSTASVLGMLKDVLDP